MERDIVRKSRAEGREPDGKKREAGSPKEKKRKRMRVGRQNAERTEARQGGSGPHRGS